MKKIIFLASLFMALNIKAAGPFIGYVQIATSTVKQSGGFNVQSGTTTNFNSTNANFSSVQIGGTVFSSSQTITTNTTWTGDHFVSSGSIVFINAGVTLTVNGTITAGAYQIFSGPGSVVFGNNFSGTVLPEWWGALCDGVNDDAIAIQAAINSISPIHGGIVQLSARQYTLKTQITITSTYCLTIQGTTIGMSPYDSGGGIVSGTQLIGTNGVNGFVTSRNAYLTIKDLQIMLLSPATTACTAIGISVSSFLVKVLKYLLKLATSFSAFLRVTAKCTQPHLRHSKFLIGLGGLSLYLIAFIPRLIKDMNLKRKLYEIIFSFIQI